MKILHTGDIHSRDEDIDEARKCLVAVIEAARQDPPDLIAIAGDLYESRNVRLDSQAAKLIFWAVSELANVAPVVIVIGTPTHDGTAAEVLRYVKARHPVTVSTKPEQTLLLDGTFVPSFRDDGPHSVLRIPTDSLQLVISLVPTPTKQYFESASDIQTTNQEIAAAMSGIFGRFGARAAQYSCPHILVGHFSIGGAFVSDSQQLIGVDIEMSTDQLELAGTQLNCLGHIHYPQKLGDKTFYCGSLFRTDFGEQEDKGFWIHDLSAHGLHESIFILTPTRRLYKLTHDFTASQDGFRVPLTPEQIDEAKDAIVRVELRVHEDDTGKIDREELEKQLAGAQSCEVRIVRVPRESVRSEEILKLDKFSDKVVEMARLRGETVSTTILSKAEALESMDSEEVVAMVGKSQRGK